MLLLTVFSTPKAPELGVPTSGYVDGSTSAGKVAMVGTKPAETVYSCDFNISDDDQGAVGVRFTMMVWKNASKRARRRHLRTC